MSRPADRCIYCDKKAKLTKEHIFGSWLKKHITPSSSHTAHITVLGKLNLSTGNTAYTKGKGRLHRPGSPHSHQLRIVCDSCNNVWMSKLQESAQMPLLQLLKGRWPVIDNDVMAVVSAWVVMVVMSLEFSDLNTITATKEERRAFKEGRIPSQNWQIYVGLCMNNSAAGSFWHRAAGITYDITDGIPEKPNTQTTTFYFGGAFFHAISSSAGALPDPGPYSASLGIAQIWPIPQELPPRPLILFPPGVSRVASEYWEALGVDPRPGFGVDISS